LNCSISLEYDTDNFTSMNIRNNSINYFNTWYNNTTLFAAWSVFVLLQILLLILFQIKNIKKLFEKVVVSLKLLLTRFNIIE
jgi:Na+/melibiose symporter-like transporter